ncbi:MAG: heme-binding protein [Pseudomonadota bacterium]
MRVSRLRTSALLLILSAYAQAEDVMTVKSIGMELARDLVNESVVQCRKMGYSISAVVVDRNGNLRAALRDDRASRFTLQIAEEKANTVILSGSDSGEFRETREDIRPELNHMDDIIMMRGGVQITAAGSRIGALGISGAPGGEKDEECALKAIEELEERLQAAE